MIRRIAVSTLLCFSVIGAWAADANPNKAPASGKGVFFVEPKDGATVTSPFKVKFGVAGMDVKPAGEQVTGTGHHHLLINHESIAAGQGIPADDTHIHFGKGQTETEVKLAPGTYKLTMQFADGAHLSYGKDMSTTIKVTVK
jgi:hypothetical protein